MFPAVRVTLRLLVVTVADNLNDRRWHTRLVDEKYIPANRYIGDIMVLHGPEFNHDPFRDSWLRYLGYTNEGKAIRSDILRPL